MEMQFISEEKYQSVVIDEAHVVSNDESQSWKSLKQIKCDTFMLLTGTPVTSSIEKFINLLEFVVGPVPPCVKQITPEHLSQHQELKTLFQKVCSIHETVS